MVLIHWRKCHQTSREPISGLPRFAASTPCPVAVRRWVKVRCCSTVLRGAARTCVQWSRRIRLGVRCVSVLRCHHRRWWVQKIARMRASIFRVVRRRSSRSPWAVATRRVRQAPVRVMACCRVTGLLPVQDSGGAAGPGHGPGGSPRHPGWRRRRARHARRAGGLAGPGSSAILRGHRLAGRCRPVRAVFRHRTR